MQKNNFLFCVLLLLLPVVITYAQDVITFDLALQTAADQIELKLPRGATTAIIYVKAPSQELSNRFMTALTTKLTNNGRIPLIDRASITPVVNQAGILWNSNISDEQLKTIGQSLNVKAVISVEVADMASHYRMVFRVLNLETGVMPVMPEFSISKNLESQSSPGMVRMLPPNTPRLNTIGVSSVLGGSMGFVLHGTFSPLDKFFVDGGAELAWGINSIQLEGKYSYHEDFAVYPYINAGFFLPFKTRGGWYAKSGAGVRFVNYTLGYTGGNASLFIMNFSSGVNLFNWLDLSFTLRTNFKSFQSLYNAGFTYRFMKRNG